MPTCANCGRESPPEFAFCPACGSPADAPPSVHEVRKAVTVVFCDVTGSTSLGEVLDPESLRKVMARYFEEMKAALVRHGGTVEKFIGDAVMAVFGIPVVHEDDALRGVRAAQEMREALVQLNKELERDHGVTLAARIGVNTGEVVAGDPASGQALVTGDAVNVAARLEQAAEPGQVLIGETTYRLVRDAVEAERLEPVTLKGKAEAIPALRLTSVAPGVPGHIRRLDSPLVGRGRELRVLKEAFERTASDRECQLFTILAPAGVGKSRLVEEFLRSAPPALVLRGRCLPYGEGITYFPVIEVVKQAAGLADFDAPELIEEKVCAVIEGEEHQELVCGRVAQLLGAGDVAVPEETFWAVRRFLEAVARDHLLILVFDDVHWGEPTFLDLVEHIADLSRDAAILLICMARPDLLDGRPGWAGGKPNATTISLKPLTQEECELLVANLLGAADVAEGVRRRISEAAEGNPLFVEEMLAVMIDDGLLERQNGRWVPVADTSGVTAPPTIQALLAARLDRLTPDERAVLERASVVGKVFFRGAVRELTPEGDRAAVDPNLMSLVRKELVRPDRSTLPGEDAFRFRHLLVRDATYEAMPKELRAELHERFAGWLERVAGDRIAEQEEILGYHLEQAFRYRSELGPVGDRAAELAAQAATRFANAGGRAFARGDMWATDNLISRATALLQPDDPRALDLAPVLGRALAETGRFDRGQAVLEEAIEVATARGDRRRAAHAQVALAELREMIDATAWRRTRPVAEAAIAAFEEAGDDLGLARAWRAMATDPWTRCRAEEASECFRRAIEHAQRAGDVALELDCAIWITFAAFFGPAPLSEFERLVDELEPRVRGSREFESRFMFARAALDMLRGRFDEARQGCARMMAVLEELGLRWTAMWAAQGPAYVEMAAADWAAAEQIVLEAREAGERLGGPGAEDILAAILARVTYEEGRYDEAERWGVEAERLDPDNPSNAVWARGARAKALARRGRFEEAERLVREAVAVSNETDFVMDQADVRMDLAEVLRLAGRSEEAVEATREALQRYERKESVVYAARARALLDELSR